MNYNEYINSLAWKIRKREIYNKKGFHCERCGEDRNGFLNVHHGTYKNIGREKDCELFILCKNCHAEYHSIYGSEPDIFSTKSFLRVVFKTPKIANSKKGSKLRKSQEVKNLKRQIRMEKVVASNEFKRSRLELKNDKAEWALEQMRKLKQIQA